MHYHDVAAAAARVGLTARGGFHPVPGDAVPPRADGRRVRTLVLIGNVGSDLWPAFFTAPERTDDQADPLDRWTRRVVDGLARALDATALYPFGGPPHHPFVAWAKRSEPVSESPIGMLVHPDHGLWHAWRAALAFPGALALPPPDRRPSPCARCAGQPCRTACPVAAFGPGGYDVDACVTHLQSAAGAGCATGCLARAACPVGRGRRYAPAHGRFHMDAFIEARTRNE